MTSVPESERAERPTDLRVGLADGEVRMRLQRYGPNALPPERTVTLMARVLGQLRDPMILLLLGSMGVTIALNDVSDTVVIALVVILNSAIGVIQEGRAERSLAALAEMSSPRATVTRNGVEVSVQAEDLVPGDVVHLHGGDIVPADLRLMQAHDLQIDEAALTGESVPVRREAGDHAMAGTVVTRGRGVGVVSATGERSSLGRIAAMVADAPRQQTPLQRRLARLSKHLVVAAVIVSGLVFTLGLAQGNDASEMLVVAVSLAVAAVPESLPAVVSVALAMGAFRMTKRSAIVRRLPAVETLGSVTVLASDKTGTLTENRMAADIVWTPSGHFARMAVGDVVEFDGQDLEQRPVEPVRRLLEAAVLCNDAHLVTIDSTGEIDVSGDPLDAALVVLAHRAGIDVQQQRARLPRISEVPFDATTRLMTTRHQDGRRTSTTTIVKGALEQILAIDGIDAAEATAASDRMADDGRRVIAVASSVHGLPGADAGTSFRLLGLIGVADPVRPSSREVVRACARAGVRVVMVTGDHPRTARSIARQVGLTTADDTIRTPDEAHPDDVGHDVVNVNVFARTRPEQKVAVVKALQARGDVVAMTGDGVNDAPALRAADIGVAMGRRGTEVARQAAEVVLADDNLRTVVAAIEEGRRIATNIRAFLRYALSGGVAEVITMMVAPLLGLGVPLHPGQILWINLLTHGLPGVAFGGQPADPEAMRRPPQPATESILGDGLWKQIAVLGTAIAAVSLVAAGIASSTGADVPTYVFLVLGLAQLATALVLRTQPSRAGIHRWVDPFTLVVGCAVALQVLAVTLPSLQGLLRTTGVPAAALATLTALACLPALAAGFTRRITRVDRTPTTGQEPKVLQPVAEGPAATPGSEATVGGVGDLDSSASTSDERATP